MTEPALHPSESIAFAQLLESIKRNGDPPCKGCGFFRHCAEQPAACKTYAVWVETGDLIEDERHPTRDIYDFVEEIVPFEFSGGQQSQRGQLLRVLFAEAPHKPRFKITPRIEDNRVVRYRNWLRSLDIEVGPKLMARLLRRFEKGEREIPALTQLLASKA